MKHDNFDAIDSASNIAPIFNLLAGVGIMSCIGCSVVASIHLSHGKTKAATFSITSSVVKKP